VRLGCSRIAFRRPSWLHRPKILLSRCGTGRVNAAIDSLDGSAISGSVFHPDEDGDAKVHCRSTSSHVGPDQRYGHSTVRTGERSTDTMSQPARRSSQRSDCSMAVPSATGFTPHICSRAMPASIETPLLITSDQRDAAARQQRYHTWVDEQAFLLIRRRDGRERHQQLGAVPELGRIAERDVKCMSHLLGAGQGRAECGQADDDIRGKSRELLHCSGLIVQFQIGTVVVGESRTFQGGIDWLRERGVKVIDLGSPECVQLLTTFIEAHPDVWNEDIGEA
jgi:hypothetical protein